jgi:hypothetical protein
LQASITEGEESGVSQKNMEEILAEARAAAAQAE